MEQYIDQIVKNAVDFAPKLFMAFTVFVVGWWLVGLLFKRSSKIFHHSNLDGSLRTFLASLISVTLKILVIISAASMVGIETTSFVAMLGAASLAVGLALQGSLSNFAGGVLILFFKPFRVGDLIQAQGFKGIVKEIQIFTTILASPAGQTVIIPNGLLSNGSISNFSKENSVTCVDLTFSISYTDEVDKAKNVIRSVVEACPFVLKDRSTDIFVGELGSHSVNFVVRPWTKVTSYWDTYFFMNEHIKKAFDREGIHIPLPQMDVHLRTTKEGMGI